MTWETTLGGWEEGTSTQSTRTCTSHSGGETKRDLHSDSHVTTFVPVFGPMPRTWRQRRLASVLNATLKKLNAEKSRKIAIPLWTVSFRGPTICSRHRLP